MAEGRRLGAGKEWSRVMRRSNRGDRGLSLVLGGDADLNAVLGEAGVRSIAVVGTSGENSKVFRKASRSVTMEVSFGKYCVMKVVVSCCSGVRTVSFAMISDLSKAQKDPGLWYRGRWRFRREVNVRAQPSTGAASNAIASGPSQGRLRSEC